MGAILFLSLSALIPGLSTHGAAMAASLWLDRPPSVADRGLVTMLAYVFLLAVALPVLAGGKIYNMLQAIMTVKVAVVLGFCLMIGVSCVSAANWWNVFSGFVKFGTVPTIVQGHEATVNLVQYRLTEGTWPLIALSNIAVIGAFAGYAGGGGLSNSTYSNFVRDKGWGMGSVVGAIPERDWGPARHAQPRGQGIRHQRDESGSLEDVVALRPGGSNLCLGARMLHGHGIARPALIRVCAVFRAHRRQVRVGTIPDHGRRDSAMLLSSRPRSPNSYGS